MKTVVERSVGAYRVAFYTLDNEKAGIKVKRFNKRRKEWEKAVIIPPENEAVLSVPLPAYLRKEIKKIARVVEVYYGLKVPEI